MYALLPFALMMLQGCWNWFRKNVLGQDDSKIPENVSPIVALAMLKFILTLVQCCCM